MRITIVPKIEKALKKSKWKDLIDTAKSMSRENTLSIQFDSANEETKKTIESIRSAVNPEGFRTFFDRTKNTLFINHK